MATLRVTSSPGPDLRNKNLNWAELRGAHLLDVYLDEMKVSIEGLTTAEFRQNRTHGTD